MWFWLFVILMMVGVGLIIVGKMDWDWEKHKFLYHNDSEIEGVGWAVSIISVVICIVMMFFIITGHTNVEAYLEQNRETYKALTYKMESTTCRDEFGFLSKEVIDEVQAWNKYIRYYQSAQDDFWVGIFYPNVYDEFETIDYESYNTGE